MYLSKVVLGEWEDLPVVALTHAGIHSNGGTWLAALDKARVLRRLSEVCVVPEATVAKEVVDLLGGEVLVGV